MEEKRVSAPLEVKDDGAEGSVQAAFSVFNVIDSDGDVVLPTAFEDGQPVPMVWSHQWVNPVGRGVVKVEKERAIFDGRFFLDTQAGSEAYKTVKNMEELQEWSFGFQVLESDLDREWDGTEGVRLLKKLQLFEVSPVLVGANRETETVAIKDGTIVREGYRLPSGALLIDGQAFYAKGDIDLETDAEIDDLLRAEAIQQFEYIETKFAGSPKNKYGTHSSRGFKGNYAAAWRCHFSKIGGGATSGAASGPIRGTVRRTEMIAAVMKPPCSLPSTDVIGPRGGPKSPLQCSFPSNPGDYGLSSWAYPSDDNLAKEDVRLTCKDLAIIKRAALAEIKRRARDREQSGIEPPDGKQSGEEADRLIHEALDNERRRMEVTA